MILKKYIYFDLTSQAFFQDIIQFETSDANKTNNSSVIHLIYRKEASVTTDN